MRDADAGYAPTRSRRCTPVPRERKELAWHKLQRVLPKSGGNGREDVRFRSTNDLARLRKTPNGPALTGVEPHGTE